MGQMFIKGKSSTSQHALDFEYSEIGAELAQSSEINADFKSLPTMESLHNTTNEIFPVPFEGVKVVLNQGINQHFQFNHSWTFGTEKQSGYKVGTTFVGNNKISETEMYPIMLGELSPSGHLSAQIMHHVTDHIKCRYIAQMRVDRVEGQQFAVEHKSDNLNLGLSVINPSLQTSETDFLLDVMRRISDRFFVGSMLLYHYSAQSQYPNVAGWNIGSQYSVGKWTAAVGLRPLQSSIHSNFHIKLNKSFQIGTEIEASLQQRQCVAIVGCQYDLQEASVCVRSQIDSNWHITTTYERKFAAPIPFSFNICVNGDLWRSTCGMGILFSIL